MCLLLDHAAFGKLQQHLRERDGAQIEWAWLRHLLTRLGLLRATVQWSSRRRRPATA